MYSNWKHINIHSVYAYPDKHSIRFSIFTVYLMRCYLYIHVVICAFLFLESTIAVDREIFRLFISLMGLEFGVLLVLVMNAPKISISCLSQFWNKILVKDTSTISTFEGSNIPLIRTLSTLTLTTE